MPEPTPAQLLALLAAIRGPRPRLLLLRPRPAALPHPRRLRPRLQGPILRRPGGLLLPARW